jgi:carboxylate-amine ligase
MVLTGSENRPTSEVAHEDAPALVEATLAGVDLTELAQAVTQRLRGRGVTFGSGAEEFRVDPVPRVISAAEWEPLAAGLAQRVRALNRFVADVYGPQHIVEAGVVPARVIASAEYFEPALAGRDVSPPTWIPLAGLDVVRDPDGEFKVLEDNVRTPSGLTYAIAARQALSESLPTPPGLEIRSLDPAYEILRRTLAAAAPGGVEDPFIVVLSDGPHNAAYYEHTTIAAELDLPLLVPSDLTCRRGRLLARVGGRCVPVDVLYRRTDVDRLFEVDGSPTVLGEVLSGPWLGGRLGLVNAFGTGVADDKLTHAYVEDIVRFYLGEEPLLRSVPTYDTGQPDQLAMVLERIAELVIKPRGGHGGEGVVVCPHARPEDVARTAAAVAAAPGDYIAQEMVLLSRQPTVCDGRLEPRHVDLRPFVMARGEEVDVLPGGLTRVAFDPGALVVNSSQNGGAKDTWVLE